MITVILLNWKRHENVVHLCKIYEDFSRISQVLVWNNSTDKLQGLDGLTKVSVIDANSNWTFYPRFMLATLASNSCVIIQDDDLVLPVDTVDKLYARWIENPEGIYGIFGRAPKEDGTYAKNVLGDKQDVPIVLTRALITHQKQCARFMLHYREFDSIQNTYTPYGNGEDIIFSYVVRKYNNGKSHELLGLPVKELPSPHAVSAGRGHYEHRTRLMQFCERWLSGKHVVPKISCACITCKRPTELAESIACFLAQDYENKELVILDDAGQYKGLVDTFENVRIESISSRFESIGAKRNACVALTTGQYVAVWDDDDIYLPWHLSSCVNILGGVDYTIPTGLFVYNAKGLNVIKNQYMYHGAWSFTRDIFNKVGGYPWIQSGQDQALLKRLKDIKATRGDPLNAGSKPSYVYRWFVTSSRIHLSSGPEWLQKFIDRPAPPVTNLVPMFSQDWVTECLKLLQ